MMRDCDSCYLNVTPLLWPCCATRSRAHIKFGQFSKCCRGVAVPHPQKTMSQLEHFKCQWCRRLISKRKRIALHQDVAATLSHVGLLLCLVELSLPRIPRDCGVVHCQAGLLQTACVLLPMLVSEKKHINCEHINFSAALRPRFVPKTNWVCP